MTSINSKRRIGKAAKGLLAGIAAIIAIASWGLLELSRTVPARSTSLPAQLGDDPLKRGEMQFSHGDLGVLDLDTLETSALPWAVLSTALALDLAKGDADQVSAVLVEQAFRSVGFLYPDAPAGEARVNGPPRAPLGLNLGLVERSMPLRLFEPRLRPARRGAGPACRHLL
ncbi:MAG: hypothetical protein ACRCVA_18640 [Phreatobacter sp.]